MAMHQESPSPQRWSVNYRPLPPALWLPKGPRLPLNRMAPAPLCYSKRLSPKAHPSLVQLATAILLVFSMLITAGIARSALWQSITTLNFHRHSAKPDAKKLASASAPKQPLPLQAGASGAGEEDLVIFRRRWEQERLMAERHQTMQQFRIRQNAKILAFQQKAQWREPAISRRLRRGPPGPSLLEDER
jgi:hypothetical protein